MLSRQKKKPPSWNCDLLTRRNSYASTDLVVLGGLPTEKNIAIKELLLDSENARNLPNSVSYYWIITRAKYEH